MDVSTVSMVCALLGLCHEFLGENQAALRSYDQALALTPNNDALLVARGILWYGESPRAIDDFVLAIDQETRLVWPYYFLAHHYVATGQYERSRVFCERGLEKGGADSIQSELAEWLAISQSELGYPSDLVLGSFDRAVRLDPSNERVRRNLGVYKAAKGPVRSDNYEARTRAAVRASALSERRLSSGSADLREALVRSAA